MIENIFKNFLQDRFGKNYDIEPAEWNWVILKWNIWVYLVIAVIAGIVITIPAGVILSLLGAPWWSFIIVLGITFVITFLNRYTNEIFLEVPGGHFGIVTLLGKIQGSIDQPYLLSEGEYRDIARIPFYPDAIFDIYHDKKKQKPMEYEFQDVKTSDGVRFEGTHGFMWFIENPWEYIGTLLSIEGNGLYLVVQEISLNALNKTFDDKTLKEMYNPDKPNLSDEIRKSYYTALEEYTHDPDMKRNDYEKTDNARDFFNKEIEQTGYVFRISSTGVAGKFYIKTFKTGKTEEEALSKRATAEFVKQTRIVEAEADRETTKIKAQGDAEATKTQGNADIEIEIKRTREVGKAEAEVQEVMMLAKTKVWKAQMELFNQHDPEGKIPYESRNLVAQLFADAYGNEQYFSIGGPDGRQLDNKLVETMAVIAQNLPKLSKEEQKKSIDDLKGKINPNN